MRNLAEYPITLTEVEECLRRLAREHDPRKTGLVGDMTPILLDAAATIVLRSGFVLDGITGKPKP